MDLLETAVYLAIAVLLFPAFGGGLWLIQSTLRWNTRLGREPGGERTAKLAAGAAWFGGFLAIVTAAYSLGSFLLFAIAILAWEAVGLYGAYTWYRLQEILTDQETKKLLHREIKATDGRESGRAGDPGEPGGAGGGRGSRPG
jgi:hypothetical protein